MLVRSRACVCGCCFCCRFCQSFRGRSAACNTPSSLLCKSFLREEREKDVISSAQEEVEVFSVLAAPEVLRTSLWHHSIGPYCPCQAKWAMLPSVRHRIDNNNRELCSCLLDTIGVWSLIGRDLSATGERERKRERERGIEKTYPHSCARDTGRVVGFGSVRVRVTGSRRRAKEGKITWVSHNYIDGKKHTKQTLSSDGLPFPGRRKREVFEWKEDVSD